MLRSDPGGGSGGWVVDFGIFEFEGMWIGLVCGSKVFGSEVRWGVWIGGVKRSTGEGKLTVSLCLARWSDWLDRWSTGWAQRDPEWAGSSAFVWIGVSLWLSSHSPWVCIVWLGDQTTMRDRWSTGWARRDPMWAGSVSVAGSEGVAGWALFLSLALSLFYAWPGNDLKWKWKCKIITGSKE